MSLTLKKKDLGFTEDLHRAVYEQIRYANFDCQALSKWATEVIQAISISKIHQRRGLEGLDLDYLEFFGLDMSEITKAYGSKDAAEYLTSPTARKRGGLGCISTPSKGIAL